MEIEPEKPKKQRSLGVVMLPKRPETEVVLKGGYHPSETIDAVKETRSELSAESSSGEENVVRSGGSIDEDRG
jgi:hypothetical protein